MTPYELPDRLWRFAARVGKVVDALVLIGPLAALNPASNNQ